MAWSENKIKCLSYKENKICRGNTKMQGDRIVVTIQASVILVGEFYLGMVRIKLCTTIWVLAVFS